MKFFVLQGDGLGYVRRFYLLLIPVHILLLTSCEEKKNKVGALYEGPVEVVNNVEVLYSEQGYLKVQMRTPEQLRYRNDDKVFPDTVNINFYDPTGALITRLRADSGHYEKNADVFVVKGKVRVVKSLTKEVLTTSELRWSPRTQKVFTDKPLSVRNELTKEITNAVGMDAEQDFSRIVFRKGTGIYRFSGP
ncbi:Lipopolysaccharide export system protein LptC [Dyadobacter sp. CECT 9275]|uniref:Lipopolysaccharide export system protein LptC n=1 Tax=Dyadobacter helix TaxID=2822344 RepID=A0A916N4J6_9BACT|nr:LPS export ABC transporter periplasmic protein LptC [Dyadobacter sp. CECT 9275]CAG4992016.1 Lipopolysaccharide export system protein LptC [Dyadobacter sp. CECT 9275]